MEFGCVVIESIALRGRHIFDGSLLFYSNSDVKLFLGDNLICSRLAYSTDTDFEKDLFEKLNRNFMINTQFEGEIDDKLHSFYIRMVHEDKPVKKKTETLYCQLKQEASEALLNAAAILSQLSAILENSGCKLIYSSVDGQDKNYTPKELLELAEQLRTITRVDRELILVQDPIVNTDIFSADRIKATETE